MQRKMFVLQSACALIVLNLFPAHLRIIETIYEHGILTDENQTTSTRYLNVPAGTCNFTLYPSNLMCTSEHPYPYWIQLKLIDLKLAFATHSENLMELKVYRNKLYQDNEGECLSAARVVLTTNCGQQLITRFDDGLYDVLN